MLRQRCRVKICGITSVTDAIMVSQAGVDAVGLNFYPKSSRYIHIEQAIAIQQALSPFVTCTGLFMDAGAGEVQNILKHMHLDLLQFHGSESPEYCQQFRLPYIKGFGMRDLDAESAGKQFESMTTPYESATGFLVDSHAPGAAGGTGQTFDWTQLPKNPKKPIILAGGLNPDNVQQAIETTGVFAVDVSSGIEQAPGIKSPEKVHAFMQAANQSVHVTL